MVTGEPLEEGWVVHSKTGEPILDPKKVAEGVLLPIGGHKGAGLALMIGLLAGVLNGAAFGRDVVDCDGAGLGADQHRAVHHRARRVALHRAEGVRGRDGPPSRRASRSRRRCRASTAIRMPGEDRRNRRAERSANGVTLSADADQAAR